MFAVQSASLTSACSIVLLLLVSDVLVNDRRSHNCLPNFLMILITSETIYIRLNVQNKVCLTEYLKHSEYCSFFGKNSEFNITVL